MACERTLSAVMLIGSIGMHLACLGKFPQPTGPMSIEVVRTTAVCAVIMNSILASGCWKLHHTATLNARFVSQVPAPVATI